jgi:hypothetical protein
MTPLLDEVEITVESYDLPDPPEIRLRTPDRRSGPEPCYLFVRRQSQTFIDPDQQDVTSLDDSFVLQSSILTPVGSKSKATVVTDGVPVKLDELNTILGEIQQASFTIAALEGPEGFGCRLAKMLLPESIRQVLESVGRKHPLIVIHDAVASKVPWETISFGDGTWFPARAAGLSRKYAAKNLSVA